ncbi:MAG: ABC-type branched-chain amino acid transport system, ATPase component [Acidimicrobiales bacterium]|jgi:branched-chain amino acid transport system ATP-binding protein|nr:ABC-type branched-chain amino acid transport system, ATPase component [Acidimicrobiales bacterium]
MTAAAATLEVEKIEVRFGGLVVLAGIDIAVDRGEVIGLLGPNGAGKSTLFNVINGLLPPHAGTVRLGGVDVTKAGPDSRARRGLARTFQNLETFGVLTVRENVLVAAEISRRWSGRRTSPSAVADELVERVGLASLASERADALATGPARLLEVARALATSPSVLLLDEPASGLTEHETANLRGLLIELAADGLSVVLVDHNANLVMSVSHRVAVLHGGRILTIATPAEVQADRRVQDAYLGAPVVSA